ncbi:MAG: hypothetical protein II766_03695 [Paludibacteraceae bacterium]|nr:hypothetical protein [Paludibacteraceae bacterium]
MPSFANLWSRIIEWFQDRQDRKRLILGFNTSAKEAFVNGYAPLILEARISKGNRAYKHQFSDPFNSGFRIKAHAGQQLSKQDTINIGNVVLANSMLVRRLVVLGFDTLEVHSDVGTHGCQWQLHDYIKIGQGGE